jgi:hypothetical protein
VRLYTSVVPTASRIGVFCGGRGNRFWGIDYCLALLIGEETTFIKRIPRGKTLLQKGFPPGPPFRKLLNGCGEAVSQ